MEKSMKSIGEKSVVLVLCFGVLLFFLSSNVYAINASQVDIDSVPLKTVDDVYDGGYDVTSKPADIITKGPWVDVRAYASFSAAIDAISTSQKTLLIPNQQNVTADKPVPPNVTLCFLQGGFLNISTGVTVTINGHVDAGLYSIFSWAGTGKVVFGSGSVREVFPEWWGAKGDDTLDNLAAFNATASAIPAGGKIVFGYGVYRFSDTWTLSKPVAVEGMGWSSTGGGTVLRFTKNTGIAISVDGSSTILKDFELTQIGDGQVGIYVNSSQVTLENLLIYPGGLNGFTAAAIQNKNDAHSLLTTVRRCYIGGNNIGWDITRGNMMVSDNNYFAFNDTNVRVGYTSTVTSFEFINGSVAEVKSSNGTTAVDIDMFTVVSFTIRDSYFETVWDAVSGYAGQLAIRFGSAVTGGVVEANYFMGNSQGSYAIGIPDYNAKNVRFAGNVFNNFTNYGININGQNMEAGNNYIMGTTAGLWSTEPWPYAQINYNAQGSINQSGISSTSTPAHNLRGSATISNTNTSASVSWTGNHVEADVNYYVVAIVSGKSGTPATGSTRIYITNKGIGGFTINTETAPGVGNSITVDWVIVR